MYLNEINDVSKILEEANCAFRRAEFDKALRIIQQGHNKYGNNKFYLFGEVCLLIDIGNEKPDIKVVEKGIKIGEKILPSFKDDPNLFTLLVNLGNGWDALYKLSRPQRALKDWGVYIEHLTEKESIIWIRNARYYYYKAAINEPKDNITGRRKFWVNYGNLLSHTGRAVEANDYFDNALSIDNKFAMALANKAELFKTYAFLAGPHYIDFLAEAFELFRKALEDEYTIIEESGNITLEKIRREYKDLTNKINNLPHTAKKPVKKTPKPATDFEKFYRQICSEERLFLNLAFTGQDSPIVYLDVITIPGKLEGKNTREISRLKNIYTDICGSYINARYNVIMGMHPDTLNFFDYISPAISRSGFRESALKNGFALTFNVLDKIAGFLNEYLGLGLEPNNVYFATSRKLWEVDNSLREEFTPTEKRKPNISWFALYNIFKDFKEKERFPRIWELKELRNAVTHNWVILLEDGPKEYDASKRTMSISAFGKAALKLLRIVKSAVIYVANGVRIDAQTINREGRWSVRPDFESY